MSVRVTKLLVSEGKGRSFVTLVAAVTEHEPLALANSLSAKLATRSRHVCALLGAGVARACRLPDVAGLEQNAAAKLSGKQATVFNKLLARRNLEQGLSRLRRIHALVEGSSQTVDGLTADDAQDLDLAICRAIVAEHGACPLSVWEEFTAPGQSRGAYIRDVLDPKPNGRWSG